MLIALLIIIVIVVSIYLFMQQPQFGKTPTGAYQEKIKTSPNYRNDQFQNLTHTPPLTEDATYWSVIKEFFFVKHPDKKPNSSIPTVKTDLLSLNPGDDVLVWFGHSSYFIQLDGKKILVDPVLSGAASPVNFTTRSFDGTDIYSADEIPPVDYLFITHDHWDHLDYKTMLKLKDKMGLVITGLGVGIHLERWGFDRNKIIEKDWNENITLSDGFSAYATPARHFSGRTFRRNTSLWVSFVLISPNFRIYIGGDSGYDEHFKAIGDRFGPFDLVILENGQYDKSWKHIHMMPEEAVQAAIDLRAEWLLPVHWSKFQLGNHPWYDPIKRVVKAAKENNVPILHPKIGEPVWLKKLQRHEEWWLGFG